MTKYVHQAEICISLKYDLYVQGAPNFSILGVFGILRLDSVAICVSSAFDFREMSIGILRSLIVFEIDI